MRAPVSFTLQSKLRTNMCKMHLFRPCEPFLSTYILLFVSRLRVLARISKMPVQNSNFKFITRPDLATSLFQIPILTTFNNLSCEKGQFTLQLWPRRWFVREILGYYSPKVKIKNCSWKFLPVQKEVFGKLPVQKRQDGSWLSPC